MPMYDLKCSQCSHIFEVFCKFDDKDQQDKWFELIKNLKAVNYRINSPNQFLFLKQKDQVYETF